MNDRGFDPIAGAALEHFPRVIPVAPPAAGSDIVVTVPGGARWDLIALTALLTTSATVASRIPALIVDDGSNIAVRVRRVPSAQAASIPLVNSWIKGLGFGWDSSNSTGVHTPLPAIMADAGWRIRTLTDAIQVGDQWSAITVHVIEYSIGGLAYDLQMERIAAARRGE